MLSTFRVQAFRSSVRRYWPSSCTCHLSSGEVVKTMFGREVGEPLFDPSVTSMAINGSNTPAFCCPAGLQRMAEEFRLYPQQYKVNLEFLESQNDDFMTGASLLKATYEGKS